MNRPPAAASSAGHPCNNAGIASSRHFSILCSPESCKLDGGSYEYRYQPNSRPVFSQLTIPPSAGKLLVAFEIVRQPTD